MKYLVFQEENDDDILMYEKLACPNRVNAYHKCSEFCRNRYPTFVIDGLFTPRENEKNQPFKKDFCFLSF